MPKVRHGEPLAAPGTAVQWWLGEKLRPIGLWPVSDASRHGHGYTQPRDPSRDDRAWLAAAFPGEVATSSQGETWWSERRAVVNVFHRLIPLPPGQIEPTSTDLHALAELIGVTNRPGTISFARWRQPRLRRDEAERLWRVVALAVKIFGRGADDPGVTGVDQLWNVWNGIDLIARQRGVLPTQVDLSHWDGLVREALGRPADAGISPEQRREIVDLIGEVGDVAGALDVAALQQAYRGNQDAARRFGSVLDEARGKFADLVAMVRRGLAAPPSRIDSEQWREQLLRVLASGRDALAAVEIMAGRPADTLGTARANADELDQLVGDLRARVVGSQRPQRRPQTR